MSAKIILVDFDGVLHSYSSGWHGVDVIADDPVPGAIPWLEALTTMEKSDGSPTWDVAIYSSRSKSAEGRTAMKLWLREHGMSMLALSRLSWPTEKPPAWLTIDDRCLQFRGVFPTPDILLHFLPWNKRPVNRVDMDDAISRLYIMFDETISHVREGARDGNFFAAKARAAAVNRLEEMATLVRDIRWPEGEDLDAQ